MRDVNGSSGCFNLSMKQSLPVKLMAGISWNVGLILCCFQSQEKPKLQTKQRNIQYVTAVPLSTLWQILLSRKWKNNVLLKLLCQTLRWKSTEQCRQRSTRLLSFIQDISILHFTMHIQVWIRKLMVYRNYYYNALWHCWRRASAAFLLTEAAVFPCFLFNSFN